MRKNIREKLDSLYYQTEIAQREADLEKVAEIKYGKIPTLLKEQKQVEQKLVKLQKTHHFLKEEVTADNRFAKSEAANALGDIREENSIPLLERAAAEHSDEWVVQQAIASLGVIGTPEAEAGASASGKSISRCRPNGCDARIA